MTSRSSSDEVRTTDGQQLCPRLAPQAAQQLQPVEFGQLEVEQQQVRQRLLGIEQELERLDAVAEHDDFVGDVLLLECTQGQGLIVGVVLDEHDHLSRHRVSIGGRTVNCEHRVTQRGWQYGPVHFGRRTGG